MVECGGVSRGVVECGGVCQVWRSESGCRRVSRGVVECSGG